MYITYETLIDDVSVIQRVLKTTKRKKASRELINFELTGSDRLFLTHILSRLLLYLVQLCEHLRVRSSRNSRWTRNKGESSASAGFQ